MKPKSFIRNGAIHTNSKKVTFRESNDFICSLPKPPSNSPNLTPVSSSDHGHRSLTSASSATAQSTSKSTHESTQLYYAKSRNHHPLHGLRLTASTAGTGIKKNRTWESSMTTAEKLYIKSLLLPRIVVSSADDSNILLHSPPLHHHLHMERHSQPKKSTSAPDIFSASAASQTHQSSIVNDISVLKATAAITTRSTASDALRSTDTKVREATQMKMVQNAMQNVSIFD